MMDALKQLLKGSSPSAIAAQQAADARKTVFRALDKLDRAVANGAAEVRLLGLHRNGYDPAE